mmetsp:Transcript_7962/g.26076  ORF Transcript_7962/g.26076 Transcript_7962/m.26076 type:complete len:93 (+) Transcript_7962:475-753(+)
MPRLSGREKARPSALLSHAAHASNSTYPTESLNVVMMRGSTPKDPRVRGRMEWKFKWMSWPCDARLKACNERYWVLVSQMKGIPIVILCSGI